MSTRHLARAVGIVLVVVLLAPIAGMMAASLLPESRVFGGAPWAGPFTLTTEHYAALIEERGFLLPIRNSLIVATLTTLVAMPCATLCAYAQARLPMRGTSVLLALLLAVSMFPQISIAPTGPPILTLAAAFEFVPVQPTTEIPSI